MNTPTQRDRLEARAAALMRMLSSGETVGRQRLVTELKDIATQLPQVGAQGVTLMTGKDFARTE